MGPVQEEYRLPLSRSLVYLYVSFVVLIRVSVRGECYSGTVPTLTSLTPSLTSITPFLNPGYYGA